MKIAACLLIVLGGILCSSCNSNSPLDGDGGPGITPQILRMEFDSDKFILIFLDTYYNNSDRLVLERKSTDGFETIPHQEMTRTTLKDTSFEREADHSFVYRIRVQNGAYLSPWSHEKPLEYTSTQLNAPDTLLLTALELQGIRLEWRDRSGKEESYKVEKDDGAGYQEIATLEADSGSYFDAIAGMHNPALNLSYRVQAYNSTFTSPWVEIETSYSGLGNPTNLRILDTSFYSFTLEWEDNSNLETAYSIERLKNNGQYEEIAESPADANKHLEFQVETGLYRYRVRAKKDDLYSSYSNEFSYFITAVVPTEGLAAHWPFRGDANDESGNDHNGIVSGATLVPGRFATEMSAYSFDGDDWITVSDSPALTLGADPFAFAIWVNFSSFGEDGGYYLLSHSEGPGNATKWFIWLANDGISFISHPVPGLIELGTKAFELDTWYHIVVQRSGNELRAYVDAASIGTGPIFISIPDPDGIFQIGSESDRPNGVFRGLIDDIRFFKRALSFEEIQALYHLGGWGN